MITNTFVNLADNVILHLKRIIEVAAQAVGNHDRFLHAGLIESTEREERVQLTTHWLEAFSNLKPLSRDDARQNPGLFLSKCDDVIYRGSTSGNKAGSFIYFAGSEWNRVRIQARKNSLVWWGIKDDTPIINVASRLLPLRAIDAAIIGLQNSKFINLLLRQLSEQPSVIRGYPSRLCEVANHLQEKKLPPIIAVICTGEYLFEYQQSLLEDTFSAPVINEYGCQETGISGLTCPEVGKIHLDTERCLYEIIDRKLTTTDLLNFTMPLVRYQCGDILELDCDPCPCGRPGLTARILGRVEDRVRTIQGIQYAGEVSLPSIEGILNYRILRQPDNQLDILIKTKKASNNLSLDPLVNWTNATFGKVKARVFLDDEIETPETAEISCDANTWIHQITRKGLEQWLRQLILPEGSARPIAQLLKALLNPAIITNNGLPNSALDLLQELLDSQICEDPQVEQIKGRILLFSCSFLANHEIVEDVYYNAEERLQKVEGRTGENNISLALDLLIPSLILPAKHISSIWSQSIHDAQCQLDVLNVHHLLYAFEAVAQLNVESESRTLAAQRLKPILSVLIGDLSYFAPRFGVWLLAHWIEMSRGVTLPLSYTSEAPIHSDFLMNWLTLRQCLIREEGTQDIYSKLLALQDSAISPEEKARFQLERGYTLLMMQQTLDPHEWLNIIEDNAGLLSRGLPENLADGVPWIPILRALVKPLHRNRDYDLAYRCLVASSPPSSRISAFERLAFQVNDKQSVIVDLTL